MTNKKQITCIVCPIGCKIMVKTDCKHFEVCDGNKCIKGVEYARAEALDPKRMLTSSVLVINGEWPLVSVKSSKTIPKNCIYSVLDEIKKVRVNAPITLGQTIIKNVAKTKINIVATKSVKRI
ncbi:molybdopterin oxidoreductase [Thermoplasmatales archaeon SG8-52-2]|nr:MAG: molybdopterin oxidoreductase [Thermoplasmatales archaeon SG8-52-2]